MALKIFAVVLVLALGVGAGYAMRPPLERYFTGRGEIDATVTEERREDDRLVLALRADDETMMATFRERIDDIDELVDVGDTVTLRMSGPGVFADDVPILHVSRPPPPPPPRGRRRRSEDEVSPEHASETASAETATEHEATAEGTPAGAEPPHADDAHEATPTDAQEPAHEPAAGDEPAAEPAHHEPAREPGPTRPRTSRHS
ncbi:MAG: hypothetical protein K1X94_12660 [Sandaracinaceae bacterium]|jgi:hypothetical protein|nr:hypothetical protein [Sandaracinaceae bacterium]